MITKHTHIQVQECAETHHPKTYEIVRAAAVRGTLGVSLRRHRPGTPLWINRDRHLSETFRPGGPGQTWGAKISRI